MHSPIQLGFIDDVLHEVVEYRKAIDAVAEWDVCFWHSPKEAVRQVKANPAIRVIVLDMIMEHPNGPDYNDVAGIWVIEKLRYRVTAPSEELPLRVVVFTNQDTSLVNEAIREKLGEFSRRVVVLTKDIHPDELVQVIRDQLNA